MSLGSSGPQDLGGRGPCALAPTPLLITDMHRSKGSGAACASEHLSVEVACHACACVVHGTSENRWEDKGLEPTSASKGEVERQIPAHI